MNHFTDTSETGIAYMRHIDGWQHIDTNDGRNAQVGPIYKTKAEMMSDHNDYLVRAGWMREA